MCTRISRIAIVCGALCLTLCACGWPRGDAELSEPIAADEYEMSGETGVEYHERYSPKTVEEEPDEEDAPAEQGSGGTVFDAPPAANERVASGAFRGDDVGVVWSCEHYDDQLFFSARVICACEATEGGDATVTVTVKNGPKDVLGEVDVDMAGASPGVAREVTATFPCDRDFSCENVTVDVSGFAGEGATSGDSSGSYDVDEGVPEASREALGGQDRTE